MDFINSEDVDWIHRGQDSILVVAFCEHGNELSSFIKWGEFLD
jgi:hypothetical protein